MSEKEKTRKDGTIIEKVTKEDIGILKPIEEPEKELFGSYMKDFGLEGFCPFIKFKNFGDFVVGKLVKIDYQSVIKGIGTKDNMYLEVIESNINIINETSKKEGEIVESLVGMTIKFIVPTHVREMIKPHNLIEGKSIVGLKKLKESDYSKFGNPMIEYEVFIKNE